MRQMRQRGQRGQEGQNGGGRAAGRQPLSELHISLPSWVDHFVEGDQRYESDEDRVRLAIRLSQENVARETGGPFGAAVFEVETGRLVSVGMNLVVAQRNSNLHAEVVALMMAQQRVGSHTLREPPHEIVTSCDPCAMCLGSILWSGVQRVVCGADREDARSVGFDEGPVFEESFRYLEDRGIQVIRGVLRDDARAVLELYRSHGGPIYNG
jgi:tRNA(Arg) A34 adenosine deaminase TadA